MKKKVLITGGSGYLGEVVVERFLSAGYRCYVLDINPFSEKLASKVVFHNVDIRNKDLVDKACKGVDVIVHCVAQVPLAKNNQLFVSVNYEGTRNILNAAENNKCSHFIYVSSSAIYGVPDTNPVNEKTPARPCEKYGKAKLDGENLALEYASRGLNVSVFRPRTILGNGRLGIFQILFEWVYQGKNIPVFDGGKNIYQFVHSYDLAEAILLCCKKEVFGVFNVGAENYCSMHETLSGLINHAKSKSKIKSMNSSFIIPVMNLFSFLKLSPLGAYHAKLYGKSLYFDVSKIKKTLSWGAKYSNIEMIQESYDWYIQNRDDVLKGSGKSHHKSAVKQKVLSFLNRFI